MARPYRSEHEEWQAELRGERPALVEKSVGVILTVAACAACLVVALCFATRGVADTTHYAAPDAPSHQAVAVAR